MDSSNTTFGGRQVVFSTDMLEMYGQAGSTYRKSSWTLKAHHEAVDYGHSKLVATVLVSALGYRAT